MPLRLPHLLLAFLLVLTACEPRSESLRISGLSTLTPSVGGDLSIYGAGFDGLELPVVSIGGQPVPSVLVRSWSRSRIDLLVPGGVAGGLVTIAGGRGELVAYGEPVHVIAALEVDQLVAEAGTRRYPVRALARDLHGTPVAGASLTFDSGGKGIFTPRAAVTTDAGGRASAVLDLTGVEGAVEVKVLAAPLEAFGAFRDLGEYELGSEVVLTDGTVSMPVYLQLGDGRASVATLNRPPAGPPAPLALPAAPARARGEREEPTEIIVAYRPSFSLSSTARQGALAAAGLRLASSSGDLDLAVVPAGVSLEEALQRLAADPRVEYAEPNHRYYLAALPNDPYLHHQWGAFAVGAPNAWTNSDGSGVTVAVIDSAIDTRHPDLAGALLPGYDFCVDIGCFRYDGDPHAGGEQALHGTHVAAIIGARARNGHGTVGIAPGARILPIKVFPDGSSGAGATAKALHDAIRWAAGFTVPNVPPNRNPAHVINLSLGGYGRSATVEDAIAEVVASGVVVVAAAGNDGEPDVYFPAWLPDVIGVGAIDPDWRPAFYSNYGPGLDLMAPGTAVVSAEPGGGARAESGTSMAAPHVAGAAALLLSSGEGLSPSQVRARLLHSAYTPDGAPLGRYGAGVVRADGALGLPAPTGDGDRHATVSLTPGGGNVLLDLREGSSSSVGLTSSQPGEPLDVRLHHSGRELTGRLSNP